MGTKMMIYAFRSFSLAPSQCFIRTFFVQNQIRNMYFLFETFFWKMKSQSVIIEKSIIFICCKTYSSSRHSSSVLKRDRKKMFEMKVVGNFSRKNFCFKLFSSYAIAHKIFTKNSFWRYSTTPKKLAQGWGWDFWFVSKGAITNNLWPSPAYYLVFPLFFTICLDYNLKPAD